MSVTVRRVIAQIDSAVASNFAEATVGLHAHVTHTSA